MIIRQNGKTVKWEKAQAMLLNELIESRGMDDEKRIKIVTQKLKDYLIKGS